MSVQVDGHGVGGDLRAARLRNDRRDLGEFRLEQRLLDSRASARPKPPATRSAAEWPGWPSSPSSSLGMNSAPSRKNTPTLARNDPRAMASVRAAGEQSPCAARARYKRLAQRINDVSVRETPLRRNRDANTGINVTARASDVSRAKITVNAIGRNILPSIPCRLRIGRIHDHDDADAEQDRAGHFLAGLADTTPSTRGRRRRLACSPARRTTFSTMHHRAVDDQAEVDRPQAHQVARTARQIHGDEGARASTAGSPAATIRPARKLPSSSSSTTTTSTPPSARFLATVWIVLRTEFGAVVERVDVDARRQRPLDLRDPLLRPGRRRRGRSRPSAA